MPQYNHRMTVFDPIQLEYEYMPNDDFYFAIDAEITHAYSFRNKQWQNPSHIEARFGRTYFYNNQTHVRPMLGAGAYRDLKVEKQHVYCGSLQQFVHVDDLKRPVIGYGFVGVGVDHEFNDRFAVGVDVKALIGSTISKQNQMEKAVFGDKSLYLGADVSVPMMVRFGALRNWELRIEPYSLVWNDGNKYVGSRSGLAYRF